MSDCKSQYQKKVDELNETIRWRQKACHLLQGFRGLFFLLAGAGVIAALTGGLPGALAYIIPAIPFVALVIAAAYNETIEYRQQKDRVRLYLNQLQIKRIERNWNGIPETPFDVPDSHFHLAKDLDLFGHASLFKLVSLANTPLGIQMMGDWLLNPATPGEIKSRQAAVEALRSETDLREDLQALSHTVSQAQTDPSELLAWSQGELWLKFRPVLLWIGRISAALMLACLVLFFIPGAPKMILGGTAMVLLVVNIFISIVFAGSVHKIFNSVGYRQRDVSTYVDLFRLSKQLPAGSEVLDQIKEELYSGNQNAVTTAGKLQSIIGLAQMRRSGLFFLVYILLQFFFLIDLHTLYWLEKWHQQHASRVSHWLNAVARWEALSSLANLAYHQPAWGFPQVGKECDRVTSKQLGHPLLSDEQRVCNDASVGPKDSILLVTGSNMSGKSTLLRAIGMNCALAQAGSVVCAETMSLPSIRIETSMRIGDSVSEGVSFFMAELKRLRQITLEADELAGNSDWTLLYLLDEILQGTNSRERQIAVIRVCEHLIDSGAFGAISTHDLELASAPVIKEKCQTVHFREFFRTGEDGKQEMSFDYVMREGVSPTTNALKLLAMVGLDDSKKSDSTQA